MKTLIYHSLKSYCRLALKFYFKKWQVRYVDPVPSGPVIFVANHQNAFLDAVILGCSSSRTPWFLTRANVFQKDFVKKIFNTLKMTPVYRFRDGFGTLRKNDEVIENCIQLLGRGESIVIFGEGNHDEHWRLRPLQKGFARIAIAAEEKNNWELDVKIVPVGIQYDSHSKFRSRVLISFGKPISIQETVQASSVLPEQLDLLITKTSNELRPLILHIDQPGYEGKKEYFLQNRILKNDLAEQLKSDQDIILSSPQEPESSTNAGDKPEVSKTQWWNPLYIYGFINHFFPWAIIRWFLKTKVKDPQFIGSLKFALGMILVPIFYLFQTWIFYSISGSGVMSTLYFLSLPISILTRE